MSLERINDFASRVNRLSDDAINTALDKATYIVENKAKELCPVGDSGQLRQSISHRIEDREGYVYTNVHYAPYVEYGTGIYAMYGNGRKTPWSYQDLEGEWHTTEGMEPMPYLHPALEQTRQDIVRIFREQLQRELHR